MAKSFTDQAGARIGETVHKASEYTSAIADAVEGGLSTAKRAAQDGRDAVEEILGDTARRVKRNPIESIALSLVVGIAIGFLLGRATGE